MHHDQIEFHNTVDLPPAPGGGLQVSRFPSAIWRCAESPMGDKNIRSSNFCEFRFVTDKPRVRLYLRSLAGPANLVHLLGNHILRYETLPANGIQALDIEIPPGRADLDPAALRCGGFAPQVYRVVALNTQLAYHGLEAMSGTIRPPTANEIPRRRWLAYGSSITQAGGTFHNYVNTAAQMLEADALNLGMGGACRIETAITNFIAGRDDWDFASFELGVNMRNAPTDNVRFAEKVGYLLDRVTTAHPSKPVFLITHFRNAEHHETVASDKARDQMEKNDILRAAAARHPGQVTLLEGTDLVPDLRGFLHDLLHPEPLAHVRLGLNLAQAIRAQLAETGTDVIN